ncbi:hypothetical protein IAU60_003476 [Kwoniella sp. DSM 27419]
MARATKRVSPSQRSDSEDSEQEQARDLKRVKIEQHLKGRPDCVEDDREGSHMSEDEPRPEEEAEDYEEPKFKDDALLAAYTASKQTSKGYKGAISESGVIKSISLIDFMCHRHVTVDFGPKMNFLVGHNGSGKSAILTAIAVALGGKAAMTGRGTGLKDLIRKGADKSVITLTLLNKGPAAFKPDVYGPHIVIERTIGTNGSSAYKFRATKDGKTLANKRLELTAICENFNINIDSPLAILTQDQARSFLQNSDPRKLYSFFLNGTQLTALSTTYEQATTNVSQLEVHIKRSIDALPELSEKVKTLQRKAVTSERVFKQKAKHKQTLHELAWSYVKERENSRDEYKLAVEQLSEKIELAEREANMAQKQAIQLDKDIRQCEQDIKRTEESGQPLKRAVQEARNAHREAQKQLLELDSDISVVQEDIDSERSGLSILQKKIEARIKKNANGDGNEQERLMQDRDKLQAMLDKFRKEKPRKQQQHTAKTTEKRDAQRVVEDIKNQMEQEQSTGRRIQDKINNLQRQSVNRLSAFGAGLDQVMRDIQKAQWKHSPPLGPLGMHVKLQDMDYRDVIQSILGNVLCSFAVRDPQDREQLNQILQRNFRNGYRPGSGMNQIPAIHLHAGDVFDYSKGDRSSLGPTILSKLAINDDHVLRLLINLSKIEIHFLARTIQQANNEMKRMHQQGVLPHVSFYSADHQSINGTIDNKASGPIPHWRGNPLFTRDLKDEVHHAGQELQDSQSRLEKLNGERQGAQAKVVELDKELRDITDQMNKVAKSIQPFESKLDTINRRLNELSSAELEYMEVDRADRLRAIEAKESRLRQFNEDRIQQVQKIESRARTIKEKQDELDEHMPGRQKQQAYIEKLLVKKLDMEKNAKHYEKSAATALAKRDEQAELLQEAEESVNEGTERARKFCPVRAWSDKSHEELQAERASLDTAIKEAEKQLGIDSDQVAASLAAAKAKYDEAGRNIAELKLLCKVLKKSLRARKDWWSETRSHMAIRAKTAFIVFEGLRAMDGRLEFDHVRERLSLIVHSTTRSTDEDGQATQRYHYKTPKNLSGGERSFSTVSFLLALWSTVPCPIRALDEWDVFLDAANRKVAAKSLMDGARESDGKQFILITPLDMAGMDVGGPDSKLIRMADPTRNQ